MRIEGRRIKQTRLIHRGRYVVAVDIEAVIPPDDPSEPCIEHETVAFLRDVAEHADRADVDWLKQHGQLYELVSS
jgi:hypothetical protein